jgi:uncharacterized protein involved in outer membrane biogenesis
MRKYFIAVGLVVICLFIIAAWNVNSIVAGNKEYLLGRLGRSFGHAVTADKIEIGYQPFGVRLANLAIAGDPADAANPLVVAKNMHVKLRFLPLLIGRLQPAQIALDSPVITIVRDVDGRYNYEPPGRERKPAANRTDRSDRPPRDRQIFAIAGVQITDGALRYRDLKNDSELALTQIDLRQSSFDEDEPVELQLTAAVMTAKPNLKFNIRVGPIAGIRDYRNYPIEGNLDAEQLDLGKVNRALPQFRRATPRHLRFEGIYDIKGLKFKGTLSNPSLKGAVSGTDASFRFD